MTERRDEAYDHVENSTVLPKVIKLTERLLFTSEQLKVQAEQIGVKPFETKRQQILLDEMMGDAHDMDEMLLELKRAIKAL